MGYHHFLLFWLRLSFLGSEPGLDTHPGLGIKPSLGSSRGFVFGIFGLFILSFFGLLSFSLILQEPWEKLTNFAHEYF